MTMAFLLGECDQGVVMESVFKLHAVHFDP